MTGVLAAVTGAAAAEWRKLRSVPSTFAIVFAVAVVAAASALVAWQTVAAWEAATPQEQARLASFRPEEGLLLFVQLLLATLGVLTVTSEYATGMIRTTLLAVPRRGLVLAAKALVVAAVAGVVGQAGVAAMFFLARLVVGDRPIPIDAPTLAEEVPRLLALGASVVVVACVGLGLGVVTRSTAGALTAVTALLFVLSPVGRLLPVPWDARYAAVTLPQLPEQVAGAPDAFLPPLGAVAALAAYVAAALAAAWLALRHRDA